MAKRNFNGSQINQSVTIAEQAGAEIADVRNLILKYDENGDVVVATDGTAPLVGIAIIEAGYNDISGAESGKVAKGRPGRCTDQGHRLHSCWRNHQEGRRGYCNCRQGNKGG